MKMPAVISGKKKTVLILIMLFISVNLLFSQLALPPVPEITAAANIESAADEGTLIFRIFYRFPENFHQTLNKDFFKAEIIRPENPGNFEIVYSDGIKEDGIINYYGSTEILLKGDCRDLDKGEHTYTVRASWQLCDEDGTCFFPSSEDIEVSFQIKDNIPGTSPVLSSQTETAASLNGITSIIKYLILAFIGGLLLNIMPCVFPLLSIKALSLVKQSDNNRKEIFLSSIFYSAGIIISLLVLAVFLIIIKNAGEFAGWGFQMQNRWFVLFLVTIIYLFALSMFDVFTITLPGVNMAGKISNRKGYTGHFLTGIFAVLVAAPCTAPFLGSAIAFSLSGNSVIIFLSFLFIGAGFSFPFILLGLNPSLIKKLPKPGKWSVYFKEILGFILAGTAGYLLLSFAKGKPSSVLSSIAGYLFLITFFAWIYGKIVMSGLKRTTIVIVMIILLVLSTAGAKLIPDFNYDTPQFSKTEKNMFSEKELNNLLKKGESVFVDIYADWCTTCKINEGLVFQNKEIIQSFSDNNVTLLKGDFTDGNREIAEWMKKNGKAGVPVYAFYKDAESEPIFLPELLTRRKILEIVNPDKY